MFFNCAQSNSCEQKSIIKMTNQEFYSRTAATITKDFHTQTHTSKLIDTEKNLQSQTSNHKGVTYMQIVLYVQLLEQLQITLLFIMGNLWYVIFLTVNR